MLKRTLNVLAFIFVLSCAALAQITGGGTITTTGAITVGHCVSFASTTVIQDAGGVCGGSGSAPGGSSASFQFNSTGTFAGTTLTDLQYSGHTVTLGSTGIFNASAASVTAGFVLPNSAGAAPTTDAVIAFNTTNHLPVFGSNGTTLTWPATQALVSHQFFTSFTQTTGAFTLAQPAFTDVSGSLACGQTPALTGDTSSSAGSCTTTTTAVNGGTFPATALVLGTNSSSQVIAAALPATDIWIGNGSNFPVARVISGDSTMTGFGVMTNVGINGTLLSGLATGILKNTTTTGVPSIAVFNDVVGLFSGCSGTNYLGADGNCHANGAGTVTSSGSPTSGQFPLWTSPTNLSGTTLPAGDLIVGTSSTPIVQTKVLADVRDSTSPAPSAGGDFCAGIASLFVAGATQVDARQPGAWLSGGQLYCNSNPFTGISGAANGIILKLPCDTITISKVWESSSFTATHVDVCDPNFAGTAANQQGTTIQKCSVAAGCGPNNYPSFDATALNSFPDGDPNAPNIVQRTSGSSWGTHFNAAGSVTSSGFTVTWTSAGCGPTNCKTVTASGAAFSSADVGGLITDCVAPGGLGSGCPASKAFTGRIASVTDSSHLVMVENYTGSNAGSGKGYTVFDPNVWPSYVEGSLTSWNQQLFGSYVGPLHFDDSGIANGLGYFSPAICQENCRLDSPGYVPNGGMAGGESNSTFGAWSWDKTFRAVSGGAHWSLLGTPNISAGTTAMTVGAASEMYSMILAAAGGGPLQFFTGTIQGGASNNIAVDVSIDGSVDFGDLDCKHFEGLQIDGVQVGVAHGVNGLNVTGCTLAQTGSMSGAAVHFKTPLLTGSNVSNQVNNISSLSSAALIKDDSNTSTNVTGTAYNRWDQLGSTDQFANVVSLGTINFRGAANTGSIQTGLISALPTTGCNIGDLYFATDATHGQSIYENYATAPCSWVQQLNSGASGANQALSNLSGVAFNASLVPGSDNALDVGSVSLRLRNVYIGTSALWTNGSGSADTGICRGAAGQIDISNGGACAATGNLFAAGFASGSAAIPPTGFITMPEEAAPGSPPTAGTQDIWVDSTDHRLHEEGNAGTVATTVVALSNASHKWLNSLSTAGVLTQTQPAISDLTATFTSPITISTNTLSISGVTGEQGNGALLQLSTGTVNLNRITKFDTNSNTINSNLLEASNVLSDATTTQSLTVQGGLSASAAATQLGGLILTGASNSASSATGDSGGVELLAGASTGATQGLQGLVVWGDVYVKAATSTLWDLACGSAQMTVKNCGASPTSWLGVIEAVNSNTDVVISPPSLVPINASAAVTLNDTVCAGGSAGQVTDSGGTASCTNSQGATVGVVMATSGAWTLPDGVTFTASTTLPLVKMNTALLAPSASGGNPSLDQVTGSASQASRSEAGAGDNYTFNGIEAASLTSYITVQDTNSTNNNTSVGLIANCAGTSTGCIGIIGNSVSGTGDLFRLYAGSTVTNGTLTGGTKEFAVSAGGVITSNATSNQFITGTGSNLTTLSFPAPSGTVVLTFPNTTDTMVGRATTDTLTNKSISIDQIKSAGGAIATIADGNNPLTLNCAQTSNTQSCVKFGETSAATNGTLTNALANQAELTASTASASTATPLSVSQGSVTGTVAFPALQVQSTWNNAGLTGQGIYENVTNTSSAVGSNLLNLAVGNVSEFSVNVSGQTTITQTAGTSTALAITNSTAASSGTSQSSPFDIRTGQFWLNYFPSTGSPFIAAASQSDCWSHQVAETNGTNGSSIYQLIHNSTADNCAGSPANSYLQTPFEYNWGVQTNTLAQPATPVITHVGTGGAATWTYTIVACIGPTCTQASAAGSCSAACNATLTTGNYNIITWSVTANADYYKVYRTVSGGTPATLGIIAVIPSGSTASGASCSASTCVVNDEALAGDATTAQAYNSTGQVYVGTGPAVGGGTGGGMFSTQGTSPTVGASTASGWYASSADGNVHIVNGIVSGTTPNDWGYVTGVAGKTIAAADTTSTTILSVTPVALAGTYRATATITTTGSASSCVLGWTATWHDINGAAKAPTNLSLFSDGTAAPALTFTVSAATTFHGDAIMDIDNSATAIVIKSTIGTGTCTGTKMTAILEKLN